MKEEVPVSTVIGTTNRTQRIIALMRNSFTRYGNALTLSSLYIGKKSQTLNMLSKSQISDFLNQVSKKKIYETLKQENSLNSRTEFVKSIMKKGGFFSKNPKPDAMLHREGWELIIEKANGKNMQVNTWQELCQSDEWFFGAKERSNFMFCFSKGVCIVYGKVDKGRKLNFIFINYEDFDTNSSDGPSEYQFDFKSGIFNVKKIWRHDDGRLRCLADGIPIYVGVITAFNPDKRIFIYDLWFFLQSHFIKQRELIEAKQASIEATKRSEQCLALETSCNEEIKKLKDEIRNKVDKDANGQVDLIESNVFMDTVKSHQKEIQSINPDFVKNFVKLENHLKIRRESIEAIFTHVMTFEIALNPRTKFESDAKNAIQGWKLNNEFLIGEMKAYTAVQYNAIHMVNALLKDDMITFYEIYEAFDQLELWHSQYEKVSTAQLKSLNDNIRSLIRTTEESTNRIVDGLGDLTYRMAEQNDNLKEIHGAVTAGNLLSAINTFQLHRISKNTRSLRE